MAKKASADKQLWARLAQIEAMDTSRISLEATQALNMERSTILVGLATIEAIYKARY